MDQCCNLGTPALTHPHERATLKAPWMALLIKNPPANARNIGDVGSIPGSGRSPRGWHGNQTQHSRLENPMDRGAWWAIVYKSWTQQLEPDIEQQTDSKLGKEYVKAIYCHPAYLTSMQSTSRKMPGWMKHKMESRLRERDSTVGPVVRILSSQCRGSEFNLWLRS